MRIPLILAALLVLVVIVPAGAVEVTSLDVAVDESGAAEVAMAYDLNWLERFVASVAVAAPGRAVEQALETLTGKKVRVHKAGPDGAAFTVQRFATVEHGRDGTTYSTPAVDFTSFGRALDRYWFGSLVERDFSPATTTLRFPDRYAERFEDRSGLPAVTHRA